MSGQVHIRAVAVSDAGLLCRMIGYLAQLDLPAPELNVRNDGPSMVVAVTCPDFAVADIVARRIAGLIGVERVDLDRNGHEGQVGDANARRAVAALT